MKNLTTSQQIRKSISQRRREDWQRVKKMISKGEIQKILCPDSKIKLIKLWPHARKHGYEIGQVSTVNYYCKDCGIDVIWLINVKGEYETIDHDFLKKHFEIINDSGNNDYFGKKKK